MSSFRHGQPTVTRSHGAGGRTHRRPAAILVQSREMLRYDRPAGEKKRCRQTALRRKQRANWLRSVPVWAVLRVIAGAIDEEEYSKPGEFCQGGTE